MHRFRPHSTQLMKGSFAMCPRPPSSPMLHRTVTSDAETRTSPPPPLLMLVGDRFELSADGISRTAYRLARPGSYDRLLVEELYDIKRATKTFILRRAEHNQHNHSHFLQDTFSSRNPSNSNIDLGSAYQTIELQELDTSEVDAVGTGAMSWESSIAMLLFFSSHPSMLSGQILELGSGCGHGGILVLSQLHSSAHPIDSFVFTDYNDAILHQCRRNIHNAFSKNSISPQVHCQTKILDWNCFATSEGLVHTDLPPYTTILASDCAYRYCDIEPLSETIVRLLSLHHDACFHSFGPINRGALHSLIDALRTKEMEVEVEALEMERFRLLPSGNRNVSVQKTAQHASVEIAKILHITARRWHTDDDSDESSNMRALD